MQESDLYDTLEALMPSGVQCINPYLDDVPLPLGNYYQFNLISVTPIAWSQSRIDNIDEEDKTMSIKHDRQNIYKVQIDFYGENSLHYANVFHHTLQSNLVEDDDILNLKQIFAVENRCFLQENKKYQRRYGFDIDLFIVDTITEEDVPYLEKVKTKIASKA